MIKIAKRVSKLPKSPRKGEEYERIINNPKQGRRKITFLATGKKKFGKYKIVSNEPA